MKPFRFSLGDMTYTMTETKKIMVTYYINDASNVAIKVGNQWYDANQNSQAAHTGGLKLNNGDIFVVNSGDILNTWKYVTNSFFGVSFISID